MVRLSVDWNLLSHVWVPQTIRAAVERRLALLWRFLDCSRAPAGARGTRFRSEEFAIAEEEWTFTYQIDLARRAAVLNHVVNHWP